MFLQFGDRANLQIHLWRFQSLDAARPNLNLLVGRVGWVSFLLVPVAQKLTLGPLAR